MLLCDSFFSSIETQIFGIFHKRKPLNSRTILLKFNLFEEQNTSNWIVSKRLRPTTLTRPRDVHVANNDLSVSSQHSIEIHSQNVVISRLEMDNCLQFLLGRKFISLCLPVRVVKRHLFVNKFASSPAQTVSLTASTTRCGTLHESKSA